MTDSKHPFLMNVYVIFVLLSCYSSLFFAFAELEWVPWGAGKYYLTRICFPCCLLCLVVELITNDNRKQILKNFFSFVFPFIPLLLGIFFCYLLHPLTTIANLRLLSIVNIILQLSVVYCLLVKKGVLTYKHLLLACVLAILLYFFETVRVSIASGVSIFELKVIFPIYPTIFAACLALVSAICFCGIGQDLIRSFLCYLSMSSGLLGYVIAIDFVQIRAILLLPFIVSAVILVFHAGKLKRIAVSVLIALTLLSGVTFLGTIPEKLTIGLNEIVSVINGYDEIESAAVTLGPTVRKIKPTGDSKTYLSDKKVYNSSWGARLTLWSLSLRTIKENFWLGSGMGKPNQYEYINNFLGGCSPQFSHFHNDHIQAFVVGGFVFLLFFLLTEILLFYKAIKLKNVYLISLVTTMTWLGLFDVSFFSSQPFTVFVGAWTVVMAINKSTQQEVLSLKVG